jgi:hypothetical protein
MALQGAAPPRTKYEFEPFSTASQNLAFHLIFEYASRDVKVKIR